MANKYQTLTTDVDPSIPACLFGDAEHLAQVITNLLSNAIKFTPEHGKVHLVASMLKEDGDTITLQVKIADSGIGMSKEQQSRVFDVFGQVDESQPRKQGGFGLGLVISKRIIEMMDGKIWVDSKPDKGSKFTFTCKMKRG